MANFMANFEYTLALKKSFGTSFLLMLSCDWSLPVPPDFLTYSANIERDQWYKKG